jgi:hypothetical protein
MARLNLLSGVWIEEKPKRKYKAPEADVAKYVDAYLCKIGAYMRVIKSDGRKLPNGRWIPSKQGKGISDRIGVLPGGRFCAVELKAQGKRDTATPEQLSFLRSVINKGGFGAVVDSVACLERALMMNQEELLKFLPSIKKEDSPLDDSPLF